MNIYDIEHTCNASAFAEPNDFATFVCYSVVRLCLLKCILLEIKHGQIRYFRKTSSLSFMGWYLKDYSYMSVLPFEIKKKNNEQLRIIAIRRFEDKKMFCKISCNNNWRRPPCGHCT